MTEFVLGWLRETSRIQFSSRNTLPTLEKVVISWSSGSFAFCIFLGGVIRLDQREKVHFVHDVPIGQGDPDEPGHLRKSCRRNISLAEREARAWIWTPRELPVSVVVCGIFLFSWPKCWRNPKRNVLHMKFSLNYTGS